MLPWTPVPEFCRDVRWPRQVRVQFPPQIAVWLWQASGGSLASAGGPFWVLRWDPLIELVGPWCRSCFVALADFHKHTGRATYQQVELKEDCFINSKANSETRGRFNLFQILYILYGSPAIWEDDEMMTYHIYTEQQAFCTTDIHWPRDTILENPKPWPSSKLGRTKKRSKVGLPKPVQPWLSTIFLPGNGPSFSILAPDCARCDLISRRNALMGQAPLQLGPLKIPLLTDDLLH